MLRKWPNCRYSVSCTTRPPRGNEVNGKDYVFLSEEAFQQKIKEGQFMEWARVHDWLYGTLKAPLMEDLENGRDVVLDVDPQGALTIKNSFSDAVSVYICPPSWENLEERLRGRASDDDDAIAKRLANARKEMTYLQHYDYLIVNKDLQDAVDTLSAILRAERRRVFRLEHELKKLEIMEEEKA
jgi:guanylate kinase